jgi:hypothetical protein
LPKSLQPLCTLTALNEWKSLAASSAAPRICRTVSESGGSVVTSSV